MEISYLSFQIFTYVNWLSQILRKHKNKCFDFIKLYEYIISKYTNNYIELSWVIVTYYL